MGWQGCCCGSPTIACVPCVDGLAAQQYQVEIAGVTNNGCSDCDDLNGTYIITITNNSGDQCRGQITISPTICERNYIRIVLEKIGPTSFRYFVKLGRAVGDDTDWHSLWQEDETTEQDCDGFNEMLFDDTKSDSGNPFLTCTVSSSTCKVTAL